MQIEGAVPAALRRSAHVTGVELAGSRARGDAGPFSDWDFVVATSDFTSLARELPALVEPLRPIVRLWDRLSDSPCYMLMLPGPVKIDFIFEGIEQRHEPTWSPAADTLQGIDDHFWDWTLWLTSKVDAGKADFVTSELAKMHAYLLEPLGVRTVPRSLADAVASYLPARSDWQQRLDVSIDRAAEQAVRPVIEGVDEFS